MDPLPNFQPPTHPAEDPNSAFSILREYRANTAATETGAPVALGPPTSHMKRTAHPRFSPSRIPAALSVGTLQSPASHMPSRAWQTARTQPFLSPDSITEEMVVERIRELLQDKLPRWSNQTTVLELAKNLASALITCGQAGRLGPNGLARLSDIFMSVGHEGTKHYMALCVNPGAGDVRILMKGELCEKDGKNPLHDKELMEMLREGFDRRAVGKWNTMFPNDDPAGQGRLY